MDMATIMQAVSTVGFPIVCCGVLFYQNEKLRQSLDSLRDQLVVNTALLQTLTNDVIRASKIKEKGVDT